MDRGMASQENVEFLWEGGRRYVIGTPKGMLKRFERQLLEGPWRQIREGLEVRCCPSPEGDETFILRRSTDRRLEEQAMHDRFERRPVCSRSMWPPIRARFRHACRKCEHPNELKRRRNRLPYEL